MCGFVGFTGHESENALTADMLEVQSYRGPDYTGLFYCQGIHLGHNRLSIQELCDLGNHPLTSLCGNYTIVFNGEIYNFKAIREELKLLGFQFRSKTDTEVILYSFILWGNDCVKKFIGMFAFCIYNKNNKTLSLFRDRAGVKPLYYYYDDETFMFSSELKSFHKNNKFKADQNLEVLPFFFQFGYIPASHTIYKNCFKLEAGKFLTYSIDDHKFIIKQYWNLTDFFKLPELSKHEDEILQDLSDILSDAVEARTVSDVPIGVFLSGGIDSTLVTAILAQKYGAKLNTFSVGFDDTDFDESVHSQKVASYFNTTHYEYKMDIKDFKEIIETLPFYFDEPHADISSIPLLGLSKFAKRKVGVVLGGDGGDEVFFGYSKYFALNRISVLMQYPMLRLICSWLLKLVDPNILIMVNRYLPVRLRQNNVREKISKFKRAIQASNREKMFENASSLCDLKTLSRFLKIQSTISLGHNKDELSELDLMSYMMVTDYKTFMSDLVLTKLDRTTMSVGLEGREPLMDHRIAEYSAQISNNIKFKDRKGKYLLCKLLEKFIPINLVDRPKSGFNTPLQKWLRTDLSYLIHDYISSKELDSEIFDIDEVLFMKKKFLDQGDYFMQIWTVLVYQMWKKTWVT